MSRGRHTQRRPRTTHRPIRDGILSGSTRDGVHIFRPVDGATKEALEDMRGIIVDAIPPNVAKWSLRSPDRLFCTTMELATIRSLVGFLNTDISSLRAELEHELRHTRHQALGGIAVIGVAEFGRGNSRSLTLILDSPILEEEKRAVRSAAIRHLSDPNKISEATTPHISLARFPNRVPRKVIKATEEAIPESVGLKPTVIRASD